MMRITETVKQLIIINIIFYIGSQVVGEPAYRILALHFPLHPDFQFWQPLTSIFMHAPINQAPGITHILFNMLGLWMFGSALEHFWGSRKFLFFYLSCGVGASLLNMGIDYFTFHQSMQLLLDAGIPKAEILQTLAEGKYNTGWGDILTPLQLSNLTTSYATTGIGASGALYGVMVAFAFMFPNAELMMIFIPIPIKAKYFVPGLLVFDLVMGLRGQAVLGEGDGVGHFAHLGGALVGFIMMWYWKKSQFNNNRWN